MIVSWIIGPQLIGMIFLVVGYLQKIYPPRHINTLYGYRTPSAQRGQAEWDEAQRYSARLMMKLGLIYILTGLALAALFHKYPIYHSLIAGIAIIFAAISAAVLLMVFTERHLQRTFNQ